MICDDARYLALAFILHHDPVELSVIENDDRDEGAKLQERYVAYLFPYAWNLSSNASVSSPHPVNNTSR